MPDSKITALTSISTSTDPANDPLVIVDVSDTSMAATGTTKKVTLNQLLGASGTATLASATITGALTLNGGTANGIPYLNASKVVTTSDKLSFAQTGGVFSTTFNINSLLGSANYKVGIVVTEDDNAFTLYGGSNYKLIDTFGYSTPNQLRFYASNVEQYRIGASGVFNWYDGAGGTRMTLNSTGLGVGGSPLTKIFASVTPPSAGQDGVRVSDGTRLIQMSISGSTYSYQGIGANQNVIYAAGNPLSILSDGQNLRLGTSTTSYALLDTSGNVGIGVTPSAIANVTRLEIKGAISSNVTIRSASSNTAARDWMVACNANAFGDLVFRQGNSQGADPNSGTDRMTLDASGFLRLAASNASSAGSYWFQVKNTGASSNAVWLENLSGNDRGIIVLKHDQATGATSGTMAVFQNGGGSTVGSITSTNTATAYNIASDYRLKESVKTLSGGIARISALKPSIYKWKSDGSSGEGFLAHELAEVVPLAVTGEKDAVNEDGTIKPQQVDLSKVVPVLVAAIQELTARVQTLETR